MQSVGSTHPEEYAQYARSVVEAETGKPSAPHRATFFGVKNSGDKPTQLSADHLIKPLAEAVTRDKPDWVVQTLLEEEATKARLGQLLGGSENSHPVIHRQSRHGFFQRGCSAAALPGSIDLPGLARPLICQDWPGPGHPPSEQSYFGADDVDDQARLLGLITFHFACYGAGTPQLDEFAHQAAGTPLAIAPHAFVAGLPKRLLGHPQGGALAAVGHVERAWGCSFFGQRADEQITVFQSALKRLMQGHPVGSAMEYFNVRHAELSVDLIEERAKGDEEHPANLWIANNDARNYAIIGDPAVRLAIDNAQPAEAEWHA